MQMVKAFHRRLHQGYHPPGNPYIIIVPRISMGCTRIHRPAANSSRHKPIHGSAGAQREAQGPICGTKATPCR